MASRTGARLLVDQLLIQGVNQAFCVPGESYLAVLDALYDAREMIKLIVNRHESGAAYMADAYARLTGQPGVVFVTRGPGATNASIGVHTAFQDSIPLVMFIGQVGNEFAEREAFQEIDYRRMFGPMTKWVAQIDSAARVPEFVARAFQTAASGRPGPVVLALPEDMQAQVADVSDALCHQPVQAAPTDTQIAGMRRLLGRARRPLVIAGGSGWTDAACDNLKRFAEANFLPVATSFRSQAVFDNRHPNYVGDIGIGINPKLAQRVREADLLIAIGPRLGEMTTSGYTLLTAPVPSQTLVHVHAGAEELGRVYQATLAINAGMPQFAARLAMMIPIEEPPWRDALVAARSEYEAWQQRPAVYANAHPALDLWEVVQILRRAVPEDAIITNGAGNFSGWANRFWRYAGLRTQLAPTSGSMGYGVPAAVAAKIIAPERTVVCFAGDGDFMMTVQELATAVQYGAGALFLVFNNAMYGTIRMHQEREFPGREHGTRLANPDFARLAQSFGAFGAAAGTTDEFGTALAHALAFIREKHLPALVELRTDPEVITPNATLSAIRATARLNSR
ncbi:MAG TPA: thiamine pyrophosphate-binding protein [Burkholderiaceae bacterium]|nr:thiamine pyrophosphate-binding protein [Burkholderiaceae bacterium]HQR69270.1 thiamine pyrophosphate-binding protein [Burkholderiaceae bacterium]